MRDEALSAIRDSVDNRIDVYVSPFTAWELGMLVSKQRLTLSRDPEAWCEEFLAQDFVALAPLPPSVLIASSFLPGSPPKDPADRIIAATAREYGYTLVTRDRALLDYAGEGYINAVEC